MTGNLLFAYIIGLLVFTSACHSTGCKHGVTQGNSESGEGAGAVAENDDEGLSGSAAAADSVPGLSLTEGLTEGLTESGNAAENALAAIANNAAAALASLAGQDNDAAPATAELLRNNRQAGAGQLPLLRRVIAALRRLHELPAPPRRQSPRTSPGPRCNRDKCSIDSACHQDFDEAWQLATGAMLCS
ncbi:uncharacterized protein LOC107139452 isoform X2 [Marmota marmota marmota]|uniref:uncharacterized protein LOC107139452 isoform X2 n=1 Tax=Marmota marmota marmota TaxID=9994 RepID=UPI0020935FDF|nr:uncharacterized protein LOC107139452 isoform X2 [Marmota marmota marmota]